MVWRYIFLNICGQSKNYLFIYLFIYVFFFLFYCGLQRVSFARVASSVVLFSSYIDADDCAFLLQMQMQMQMTVAVVV